MLARIDVKKKTVFDREYADKLYEDYKNHRVDDSDDRAKLARELKGRKVLLLAPGATMTTHKEEIVEYIIKENPIVISVNFLPDGVVPNFAFFSNNKQYDKFSSFPCRIIAWRDSCTSKC